jgi:uncharacterized protein (DUF433 family)
MANRTTTRDALIDRYIRLTPGDTPDRAWLADSGVDVWAIIGYLRGFSIDETAADYEIPREAVEAALAYYDRHKALIDARLRVNDAAPAVDAR